VAERLRKLKDVRQINKLTKGSDVSTKDLSKIIRQMPEYQKELNCLMTHLHLAEQCMTAYKSRLARLCSAEQVPRRLAEYEHED
jgi:hypothetical protein